MYKVYLKCPKLDELRYTQELLADEATMSFNAKWGGTVPFPPEQWKAFFDRYINHPKERVYYHIRRMEDDAFLGEVSARYETVNDWWWLNIKILASMRGNGYGRMALELFLYEMFAKRGASQIVDDVARDNIGAQTLLKRVGFRVVQVDDEVVLMRLLKGDFERKNIAP